LSTSSAIEPVSFPSPDADGAQIGGRWIRAADGASAALVLIPDVHGVSPLYCTLAERLAAAGFGTLVLDIYAREGAPRLTDIGQVNDWIAGLPDERVLADVAGAQRYLRGRADVGTDAVGVLGFCLGGQYALMAACCEPAPAACVSFYGMLRYATRSGLKPKSALDRAPDLACPLLGLYGADDPLIPAADVAELREILGRHGKDFDLVTYDGAGHAFLNETRPEAYRAGPARDAWQRALTFLHHHLR